MIRRSVTAFVLASAVCAPGAFAQEDEGADKVQWNGFLSQAWAIADDRQVLGIPDDGTFEYRNAALQFRYTVTPKDAFVLQLSQDRLGVSPADEGPEEIELEFVFYQRTLPHDFSLRAGRVKLPLGIYNEIRDVGTLLPFYRPSTSVYLDGSFVSEALDGVVVSRQFPMGSWSLDADAYVGEWEFSESTTDPEDEAHVEGAVGGQLMLNTPVDGLRFGLGGWTSKVDGFGDGGEAEVEEADDDENAFEDDRWKVLVASAQAQVSRVTLTAEMTHATFDAGDYTGGYVLASVKATDKLSFHVQREIANLDFELEVPGVGEIPIEADYLRGWTAGASYAFRPNLVAKLERHWEESYGVEDEPIPTLADDPVRSNYLVASFSVSF
jgi:hypothetical protein